MIIMIISPSLTSEQLFLLSQGTQRPVTSPQSYSKAVSSVGYMYSILKYSNITGEMGFVLHITTYSAGLLLFCVSTRLSITAQGDQYRCENISEMGR
jgi:hypothetical protein